MVAFTLAACAQARDAPALTGKWERVAFRDALGGTHRQTGTMILDIASVFDDSVVGRLLVAPNPDTEPDSVVQADLRGIRLPKARVSLVAFVPESTALDNILEGYVRGDTIFVTTYRFRSGKNIMPLGDELVFVRQ